MKLARAPKYWAAAGRDKVATLEKHVDVARMFRAYTWEDLPTRYLKAYSRDAVMHNLSRRAMDA
jgi:hypothetical protein